MNDILKVFLALLVLEGTYVMALASLFLFGLLDIAVFGILTITSLIIIILTYAIFKLFKTLIVTNRVMLKMRKEKLFLREALRKPRKRYLVFQVISSNSMSKEDVNKLITELIKETLGFVGLGSINAKLIQFDEANMKGILRYVHAYRELILFALGYASIKTNGKIAIIPLKSTGTLRKAREIVKIVGLD